MFYAELLKKINEHKNDIEQKVLRGQLDDFSSYQHLIGMIKGLESAITIIKSSIRGGKDE